MTTEADRPPSDAYPEATVRFLDEVAHLGVRIEPVVYPDGTKTAVDAARAVGCDVAAIAKSLLFMADGAPVLILMAGDRRVDPIKVAHATGAAKVRRATLDEVRRHTGFAAGGTPPFGHPAPVDVLADESLRRNQELWAAAGTPTAVFPISLQNLIEAADARWVDVAES